MNERLKELIKQAGLDDEMFPLDDGWENPELITFAELIVRECAELMYGRDENGNCKDGDVIKKHFGVEE